MKSDPSHLSCDKKNPQPVHVCPTPVKKIIPPTRALKTTSAFNDFIFVKLRNRKIQLLASITCSSIQCICATWGMTGVYIESRLQSSSYGPQNGDYSHCVCVKNTPMCLQLCHNNPAERRLNNQSCKGFRER